MNVEEIIRDCKTRMDKTVQHFERELRGIRTGRASTALIDSIKVEYYGNPTDLRELAAISVPEPTRLLVKPFDPTVKNTILKAIETADLGLNPQADGDTIRVSVPAPSSERRQQLVTQVKKMAEESRVAVRNERRDAIKHIDQAVKDKENHLSEDAAKGMKSDIDEMTKKHTKQIDDQCAKKSVEVETI